MDPGAVREIIFHAYDVLSLLSSRKRSNLRDPTQNRKRKVHLHPPFFFHLPADITSLRRNYVFEISLLFAPCCAREVFFFFFLFARLYNTTPSQ